MPSLFKKRFSSLFFTFAVNRSIWKILFIFLHNSQFYINSPLFIKKVIDSQNSKKDKRIDQKIIIFFAVKSTKKLTKSSYWWTNSQINFWKSSSGEKSKKMHKSYHHLRGIPDKMSPFYFNITLFRYCIHRSPLNLKSWFFKVL